MTDVYSTDTLDKGMIRIPGETKRDGVRFYHASQNGWKLKTFELLIAGILYLLFFRSQLTMGDQNWE